MNNFCITKENEFNCVSPIFEEFDDEITIMKVILEYFKRYLPGIMIKKLDCYNKPIVIDPRDIDVTFQKDFGNYVAILIPSDDNSVYPDDNFKIEETEYVFQFHIEVRENDSEGALENLIKFKSGIKTMLVNMDQNLGLITKMGPFSYNGPFNDPNDINAIIRTGTYTFSVKDTHIKQ